MATYVEIINSVMRRLREDTVASPADTSYSQLIGEFVNETKREIEDAWKWNALRTTYTVTTADNTAQYAITGAGKRFRLQDPRESVYNATSKARLRRAPAKWMKEQLIANTGTAAPTYYYFSGFDSSEDPYVSFYNIPDGVYSINLDLVVPQADLAAASTVVDTPSWPLILGTYAKAIAERGEDDGRSHGEALNKYGFALSDAIAIDESLNADETTWEVM